MDVMRKFADSLGAGAVVSTMSDESLMCTVRQLLGYCEGDTFERLQAAARLQASLLGHDIDTMITEKEQRAVFAQFCADRT